MHVTFQRHTPLPRPFTNRIKKPMPHFRCHTIYLISLTCSTCSIFRQRETVLSCLVLSCLSVCVCVCVCLPHMLLSCMYGDTPRRSAILPALLATFSPVWPVSAYSSLIPSPEKRRLPCRLKERETLVRWCGSNPYSSLQRSQLMVRHTMMNN
jgi:hypothetical protein